MSHPEDDNPLEPSAAHLKRIRERAHHLWDSEGRPEGQAEAYLERARELDALETYQPVGLPNPITNPPPHNVDGVVIEDASLQANLGEFTDLGETMSTPETRDTAKQFRDGER
jgi:hypothetical protein